MEFERGNARALDASIGTASTNTVRAAFGGDTATQFTGPEGLKDVQVIYPESDLVSLGAVAAIPIRANKGRSSASATLPSSWMSPAPPLIMRINRRNVVLIGSERRTWRDSVERAAEVSSGACARSTSPRTSPSPQ